MLTSSFLIELQQELLDLGYDTVELRYLSDDGLNAAIDLTFNGVPRHIGLYAESETCCVVAGVSHEFSTARELALKIFDRDPGVKQLPDFRKFTGLTYAKHQQLLA